MVKTQEIDRRPSFGGPIRVEPVEAQIISPRPSTSSGRTDERLVNFAALVGEAGWARLPAAIRKRFAADQSYLGTKIYAGTMQVVHASFIGKIIALFCRLIGTPLAPYIGSNVPTEVRLYKKRGGVCWERIYAFAGKAPVSVKSVKIPDAKRGLLECVGAGFGMTLNLYEQDRALHFVSTGFFWQAGPVRHPLPDLLSPGAAHVIHTELGGGFFRFTMAIRHKWFGETFFQDGVFSEKGDGS